MERFKLNPQQEASRPVVTSITMYDKDNYVNFSDTDSSSDYFHSYTLGINQLIDWFTKDRKELVDGSSSFMANPATVIKVTAVNGEVESKHIKRVERLAKALRYKIKQVHKKGIYRKFEGVDYDSKAPCFFISAYDYIEWYIYDANLVKEEEIITQ